MPPHHTLNPLPRSLTGHRDAAYSHHWGGAFAPGTHAWERLDQVQILGNSGRDDEVGHSGCVNALSWSDDGNILLSGSDDKCICVWTPDTTSSSSRSISPHPLRQRDKIITGHRANIFSARFLPHTQTIVSCAGDHDVRVFDIERLGSAEGRTIRAETSSWLWGVDGPGTRVLRCHNDRTKRIATEASPYIFLTVSEDGTVRQHDLRRPHTCRVDCPDALFRAPAGVDLYSLSVSPAAPHTFAVAGQTDVAYVCDRRQPASQSIAREWGWGPHATRASQVHCVRRLGLPEEEWESVGAGIVPGRPGRMRRYRGERHITCVKISADHPDEVICAFAMHSTSLFNLRDSVVDRGMREGTDSGLVPPNEAQEGAGRAEKEKERKGGGSSNDVDTGQAGSGAAETQQRSSKRLFSALSTTGSDLGIPRSRVRIITRNASTAAAAATATQPAESSAESSADAGLMVIDDDVVVIDDDDVVDNDDDRRELAMEEDDHDSSDDSEIDIAEFRRRVLGEEDDVAAAGSLREQLLAQGFAVATDSDYDDDEDEDDDDDDDDEDADPDVDGDDVDIDSELDDFGDDDDDDFGPDLFSLPRGAASSSGRFKHVDEIHPRRSFKGAANVQTVKDCNFLGFASDHIAQGSDDGNFFVWDKTTGALRGIWKGDRHIVNVMEQHPTLPLVAVSGIDNTVKVFAPTPPGTQLQRSMVRTGDAETIIERNVDRSPSPDDDSPPRMPMDAHTLQFISQLLARRAEERGVTREYRAAVIELLTGESQRRTPGVGRGGGEGGGAGAAQGGAAAAGGVGRGAGGGAGAAREDEEDDEEDDDDDDETVPECRTQ